MQAFSHRGGINLTLRQLQAKFNIEHKRNVLSANQIVKRLMVEKIRARQTRNVKSVCFVRANKHVCEYASLREVLKLLCVLAACNRSWRSFNEESCTGRKDSSGWDSTAYRGREGSGGGGGDGRPIWIFKPWDVVTHLHESTHLKLPPRPPKIKPLFTHYINTTLHTWHSKCTHSHAQQ